MSTNRPAPPRSSLPPRSSRRSAAERSAVPLLFLRQLPRWLPPVMVLVLLVTGLAVRGWAGAVALVVVAALLGWLALVSWPGLAARGRLGRAAVIACLLGLAVFQATR